MRYPLTTGFWTSQSTKQRWSESAVAVSGWPANAKPAAPTGVFGRLGLRNGDAVKFIGSPDRTIVDRLPGAIDRGECADGEQPDVYLIWAANAGELREELANVASEMSNSAVVWAISAHPGKVGAAAGTIRQNDLLDAGHRVGLVDNRVACLSDSEYGYRFTKPRSVLD